MSEMTFKLTSYLMKLVKEEIFAKNDAKNYRNRA